MIVCGRRVSFRKNMPNNRKPQALSPEETPLQDGTHRLFLRTLNVADYDDVNEIMNQVYARMGGAWKQSSFESLLAAFPEGQICIEDNGKVVAAALSLIVQYSRFGDNHSYDQITGTDGRWSNHDEEGDTLYGIDVFVHPEYRDLRLGRRLYDARKQLCEELNLRRIITGGRIPGYHVHANEMSVKEYISRVKSAEIRDPVLSFQLKNDFHVRKILRDYIPEDRESGSYAALLEWINIYYEDPDRPILSTRKTVVRVGAVQWQMRRVHGEDGIIDQVEYFVDAIAGYKADFVLLPEFFNGPLMAESNDRSAAAAIRHLASHTDSIVEAISRLAVSYNVNIIAGSMPVMAEEKLYNVSYLCRRDGTRASQSKLHVTPDEFSYWGMVGGNQLSVFETDVGKVGILICYDVEFPELPRLLAEQGMKILFVPYWTDTKNGYLRVRRCAQARAIENECYVVITGSVGNLPRVENMDIQYSQAAVFTPADFPFAHDAIAAEATPNTEMTLVTDLDLDLLKDLRYQGSVRNFLDRRTDLYNLKWIKPTDSADPSEVEPPVSAFEALPLPNGKPASFSAG